MKDSKLNLKPGEIRLDYIPMDWPLTPLGGSKDPYVSGWQNKPFGRHEIDQELASGDCKAVGLLSGPVYNHPFGLVWVDVDGASVYRTVEQVSGLTSKEALPITLTILSGKPGREKKLYRLNRDKHKHFIRNKYTWHAEGPKEKLEILWSKHQGVLMGLHPQTDGYFTSPNQGFEFASNLPELPDWILNAIVNKNVKQGVPVNQTTRIVGPSFAINARVDLARDMQLATEAMWALPLEAVDDHDIWIAIGQSLHSLDDSLLDDWDEWSRQSGKYRKGECKKRWRSFDKGGARTLGSLFHHAKENGWKPSEDYKAMGVDDLTLEQAIKELEQAEKEMTIIPPLKRTPPMSRPTPSAAREQKPRNPSSDVVANVLLQTYKGNARYSQTQNCFFIYEYKSKGLWSNLSETEMKGEVKSKLELVKEHLLPNGYSMNLVNDVLEQLRVSLIFDDWYEDNEHLLFTNGILCIETKEFINFDREMHMTQQLPYDYDPAATCEPIIKWLKYVQDGNWDRVQVLRAWLRAVLLSNSNIQKFVEIVGPGKSGKSTYSNLAHALVGDDNAMISSLEHLEKNRFETANLYKKKLLLFNDVERYGG